MFCGFNLGMAGGASSRPVMIRPMAGTACWCWRRAAPGAGPWCCWLWLPESARYLVVHGKSAERIRRVLAPIGREAAEARHFVVP